MWSYALVLHLAGLTRCGINRLARVRQIPTAVMGILSLFSSSEAGLYSKEVPFRRLGWIVLQFCR